jgi:tetratricopeptide (TPR) repeat protein
MAWRGVIACALLCCGAGAEARVDWTLAVNAHFEVYSDAGPESARAALAWLEQLRGWLIRETGLKPDRLRAARVIGFATPLEYAPFRLRETADAYYIGTEGRDYIVMTLGGPRAMAVAAHEYAHMALHSAGLRLPVWLGEGLADVFADAAEGRPRDPQAVENLRRKPWLPIAELLRIGEGERERQSAEATALFYAESRALAGMLVFSPEYQGRLRGLVTALAAGTPGETALATVYGKTVAQVGSDLRGWVDRGAVVPRIAPQPADATGVALSAVSPERLRVLLATLLLDSGQDGRAAEIYRELPQDLGDVKAGLGLLAHYAGDEKAAREHWRRAIELGTGDDALCFRYAMLAENSGAPPAEVRAALERAIAIRPEFDDARFRLALLDKNEERFEAAIGNLRAMREIAPARAFAYWSALSDALNSMGRLDEAEEAAHTAARHASTREERTRAAEQAYVARTEVVVQLRPDAAGRPQMVTMRVPRGTADWNPFIDPRDVVRRAEGVLREIDCAGTTRFVVEAAEGRIALAVPDPARVQMKNAPEEFTCGAQDGRKVSVVYAAAEGGGLLRGIKFW